MKGVDLRQSLRDGAQGAYWIARYLLPGEKCQFHRAVLGEDEEIDAGGLRDPAGELFLVGLPCLDAVGQRVGGGGDLHSFRIQNCRGFFVSSVSPRSFQENSATAPGTCAYPRFRQKPSRGR